MGDGVNVAIQGGVHSWDENTNPPVGVTAGYGCTCQVNIITARRAARYRSCRASVWTCFFRVVLDGGCQPSVSAYLWQGLASSGLSVVAESRLSFSLCVNELLTCQTAWNRQVKELKTTKFIRQGMTTRINAPDLFADQRKTKYFSIWMHLKT